MCRKKLVLTRFSHQFFDMACRFGQLNAYIYVLFQQTVNIFSSVDLKQRYFIM